MNQQQRTFGWRPQLPDRRDYKFAPASAQLPPHFDLREDYKFGPILNQGNLGSCTANSIAGAFEFNEIKAAYTREFTPSRLFIYYNERKLEGNIGTDSGAALRDGFKSINSTGVCSEELWPYDISKFATEPAADCYDQATTEKVLKYRRVPQTVDAMRHALFDEHQPICFGFTVYESFETPDVASSGDMPMPAPSEKVLGGHAVLAVGFDDANERFIIRNSWGTEWGQGGYFTMPYEFISDPDSASDFWIIETIDRAPAQPGDLNYESTFPVLKQSSANSQQSSAESPLSAEFGLQSAGFDAWKTCTMDGAVVESPADPDEETNREPNLEPASLELAGNWSSNGSQVCQAGQGCDVTWSSGGDIGRVDLMYCCSTWGSFLSSWSPIAQGVANNGSYRWSVKDDVPPDTRYWLRVAASDDPSIYSESAFFIVEHA